MLGRTCRTGEISTRSKKTIEGVVENENGDNKYAESADCVKKKRSNERNEKTPTLKGVGIVPVIPSAP